MSDYTTACKTGSGQKGDEKVAIINQLAGLKTITFTREDYARVKLALNCSH